MNYTEFLHYKEQHCRFMLKSGKEVYGVIWERSRKEELEYYFASSSTHKKYKESPSTNEFDWSERNVHKVLLEDVIKAEIIKQ